MLFLPSGGLRAFALCTLTFLSPFWALVNVWSCRVPIPDSDLSELPFVIGQHVLGWTWSAALWSVAIVVLGGSPGTQLFRIPATWIKLLSNDHLVTCLEGIWLFVIVIMGVMGFLFVIDPFYRTVLRKFGPNELCLTEPPRKFILELFRFQRLAVTATPTRLVQRIRDWIVVRMARANTAPHSQLKVRTRISPFLPHTADCCPLPFLQGTHSSANKSFSPV